MAVAGSSRSSTSHSYEDEESGYLEIIHSGTAVHRCIYPDWSWGYRFQAGFTPWMNLCVRELG